VLDMGKIRNAQCLNVSSGKQEKSIKACLLTSGRIGRNREPSRRHNRSAQITPRARLHNS